MTTLEKVARAMHDSQESFYAVATPWEDENDYVKTQWSKLTRAALEALKNLEPAVVREGEEVYCAAARDNVATVWTAMLGAILNEKES